MSYIKAPDILFLGAGGMRGPCGISIGRLLIRHAGHPSPRLVRGTVSGFLMALSLGLAGNVFGIF
ncbi:hypothetical protein Agau_C201529 [Agrobacterium tumefaciens F2]|nr:hypothetical protein Agau_C201529 [Agrobacterium tumefaciens F2]